MSRPCPQCGAPEWKRFTYTGDTWLATDFSLPGAQMKASICHRAEAILSCRHCDFTVSGYLDFAPGDYDPETKQFAGGHFIPLPPEPRTDDTKTGERQNEPGA